MPGHETPSSSPEPSGGPAVDAIVQAQVAVRLTAGLFDHLMELGVLQPGDAARIAETAAAAAEHGTHSLKGEIAEALRRIIVR